VPCFKGGIQIWFMHDKEPSRQAPRGDSLAR
jgi:hypothetical protein